MTDEVGVNLQADDFTLFGVARAFEQDTAVLARRWRELQAAAHPDRFATDGAVAQRLAMQWAVRINEAYQRLKDPVKRASLLCEMNGFAIDAERNTAMPAQFLMYQMEWREALDEVADLAALEALEDEVLAERRKAEAALGQLLDQKGDYAAAAQQVRALMFVAKFARELDARAERFGR
ncbi:MAG: Co-chaperone protein HscB [Paracidovorax wautersii]|uniref:Co-chaperone protein HscB homolog n=1 Tax=Paracidovorax wautersii TaxID=1177982 RepID=A0A7V8FMV4_9BURK|nr:MAG: Co-chaperone protein HscB [Paracidovorax wautersii]